MVDGTFDLIGDAALLGLDLAAELEVSVGDEILVYSPMNLVTPDEVYFPEKLIVKGIFNSGQRDFDSGFLITSLAVGRDLMGLKQGAYSIHVKTSEPQNMPAFTRCVEAVRDAIGPKYRIRTWQEIDRQLFNALAVEKNMMVILLMFITIVAIFCVTVTLIVITVQKTNEIGLLKALGFSWQQITLTFMIHGWIQCIIGTILGIGAALLILNNMQALVNLLGKFGLEVFPKSIYGLEEIPWRLIPAEIVQVVISVLVFCSVASIVPALLAALKDPVVALRRE
jgi:lipoprotein-releasing system permease protein